MQELPSAIAMVQFYSEVQPNVRGRNVYMQFSSHQELTSPDPQAPGQPRRPGGDQPNRILLVTVHNPLYPITVDVLHQVFSPHGFVEKIVTFQKSAGLQALVQFQLQRSAEQSRNTLQGRNVYDGCCTLDIQFSNLQELQVNYNNERTRDFTNSALPAESANRHAAAQHAGNIVTSLFGAGAQQQMYSMAGAPRPGFAPRIPAPGMMNMFPRDPELTLPEAPLVVANLNAAAAATVAFGGQLPPGVTGTNDKTTILVSNLNQEVRSCQRRQREVADECLLPASFQMSSVLTNNCVLYAADAAPFEHSQLVDPDKLFNLFSNYGNVLKIKMLHNKPDHALVEMGDGLQAELAINFLKGAMLFGKKMELNYSKHPHINPSPDTRDFSSSNLNRFNRSGAKNYRHCCPPTRMLHASNLPADATTDFLTAHLAPHGVIQGAKMLDNNGKKQILVLFATEAEATDALACLHASLLNGSSLRLAFSKLSTL
eukprot:SM000337S12900  [mRNA]  locus=s337:78316:82158:- [translate_table: standard]